MKKGVMHGFKTTLRDAGFRATKQRIALLRYLQSAGSPLSITTIAAQLQKSANETTVYRALEALAAKNIVTRVDLRHSHAHYELAAGNPHHHHIVCDSCGTVEDIAECPMPLKIQNKKFAAVSSHSFEVFGTCLKCA